MKNSELKTLERVASLAAIVAMPFVATTPTAWAQQTHVDKTLALAATADIKPVAWDTFVRAESNEYFNWPGL